MAKAWNHSRTSSVSNSPILGRGELDLPDQKGAARDVDGGAGQRLVHGQSASGIAADALAVAQRLGHGLAQGDAGIFRGVVEIDVEIALGSQR